MSNNKLYSTRNRMYFGKDKEIIANEIKEGVEWLYDNDCGCCTIRLDDHIAICVGWSDGYDEKDSSIIHSRECGTWAIVAGLKVWTSDSGMLTDFDWINFPYWANGDVWDTTEAIAPKEDYDKLVDYFLKAYDEMKDLTIAIDGLIMDEEEN